MCSYTCNGNKKKVLSVSSDIEESFGLLFLLKFPLSQFGPVWNLELPNLDVKEAVFLPYFSAYEMTSNFYTILDKPHLANTIKIHK